MASKMAATGNHVRRTWPKTYFHRCLRPWSTSTGHVFDFSPRDQETREVMQVTEDTYYGCLLNCIKDGGHGYYWAENLAKNLLPPLSPALEHFHGACF